MPISGKRYRFTKDNVDKSPRKSGVFALYEGDLLIFIGGAADGATLRSQLQSHEAGRTGHRTRQATHYRREVTPASVTREIELLAEHKALFGGSPRANGPAA